MKANKFLIFTLIIAGCTAKGSDKSSNPDGMVSTPEAISTESISNSKRTETLTNIKKFDDLEIVLSEVLPSQRAQQLYDLGSEEYKKELLEQRKLKVYRLRFNPLNNIAVLDWPNKKYVAKTAKIEYFMSIFPKSVKAVDQSGEYFPVMSHFEQPSGMFSHADVLIGFEAGTYSTSATLEFEDDLFNKGRIKLKI